MANITKVTTGKSRLSYAKNLLDADEKGAFGLCILIPKSDTATLQKLRAAVEAFKTDEKAVAKWGSKFLGSFKTPIKDGDVDRDTAKYPEFKGHYFINANTYTKPGVVDAQMNPILDKSQIYSGCYVRISVTCGAYNKDGNKGIKFWLGNVQKLADGDRLGGSFSSAEDDFTAVEEDFLA